METTILIWLAVTGVAVIAFFAGLLTLTGRRSEERDRARAQERRAAVTGRRGPPGME